MGDEDVDDDPIPGGVEDMYGDEGDAQGVYQVVDEEQEEHENDEYSNKQEDLDDEEGDEIYGGNQVTGIGVSS